jgi:hypothetical protein
VARSVSAAVPNRASGPRGMRALGAVALVVAAAALAGCATTQEEAARLQLNSARIRASQVRTRVAVSGNVVRVTRVALVSGRDGTAFVVRVHNTGARAVSDLPISVGVRVAHKPPRYLNLQSPSEFSYYDAHLPAVAAGGTLTWVYATARRLPARARPFAIVGDVPSVAVKAAPASRLPVIRASSASTLGGNGANAAGAQLAVVLQNLSTIPQYQLQVYAYALSGDRYVAAGNLTVPHLGSQARQTSKVALLGRLNHARLQIEALPTIVQ